jgi:NAD(P)-dependent dehydrogenase (short-subunit alcohol dehydrogenase family)
MSLANQTVWVVGGVGVIGRGIARGLLQAGATVVVNSRSPERLERVAGELDYPNRLILVQGSLLPGHAARTVESTLSNYSAGLHHVVAHGAVRYWTTKREGCDETYSLSNSTKPLLEGFSVEEFISASSQLAALHFSAAQALIPRLQQPSSTSAATYTFVTGDGGGPESGQRSAMGEINSHHVWGLSAALRRQLYHHPVTCRELRMEMPISSPPSGLTLPDAVFRRARPLAQDIGDLCAGLASHGQGMHDSGALLRITNQSELERYLFKYNVSLDHLTAEKLPNIWEMAGSL